MRATALSRAGPYAALIVLFGLVSLSNLARAADFDQQFNGLNDFGQVGLMQTPTARNLPDGEFAGGISVVHPYDQLQMNLQVLSWVDSVIRYTRVTNRRNNIPQLGINTISQEASADLKFALADEGRYTPAVALGFQDFVGTGLFSAEYLVSSYHYYDFDFSAGLGWGRLAAGSKLYNPFRLVSKHFDKNRQNTATPSGSSVSSYAGLSRLFTGASVGIFGGMQWNTPIRNLAVRLEYDPNNYENDALGNVLAQASRINVGLNYRPTPWADVGVAFERGNTVMLRLALRTNFNQYLGPTKSADPPPPNPPAPPATAADSEVVAGGQLPPAKAPPEAPGPAAGGAAQVQQAAPLDSYSAKLKSELASQGFRLLAVKASGDGSRLDVWLTQDRYRNPARALGRAARTLDAVAPPEVREFELINLENGMETYRVKVPRDELLQVEEARASLDLLRNAVRFPPLESGSPRGAQFVDHSDPSFSWDTSPGYRQSIGGSDVFYAYQLYWVLGGTVKLNEHWNVDSLLGFNIYNNFSQITLPSNSTLPHVRSDIAKYLQEGQDSLTRLETNYVWSPMPAWYARLSAGIFEEMYGGVAGELLYHPFIEPWAVGLDINRVRQRNYNERLSFLHYQVTTGHLTCYYRLPIYSLLTQVSYGRYLAGDWGVTLDVSRQFQNGIRTGIYATKTSVSTRDFGEGSLDKGIYISVPFDLFLDRSTRRTLDVNFRPLTRDGGQPVRDGTPLYPIVSGSQLEDFGNGWNDVMN